MQWLKVIYIMLASLLQLIYQKFLVGQQMNVSRINLQRHGMDYGIILKMIPKINYKLSDVLVDTLTVFDNSHIEEEVILKPNRYKVVIHKIFFKGTNVNSMKMWVRKVDIDN